MLFDNRPNKCKYHEQSSAVISAVTDCSITIGVAKTTLKEGRDGFNHADLAKGAIQHLLSYDEPKTQLLKQGSSLEIESFTAYQVIGEYTINAKEVVFSVS